MKIGIITIQDNSNYGNRLQNYAVCKIIESYGMQANTMIIKNKEDFLQINNSKKWIKKVLPIQLISILSDCKKEIRGNRLEVKREKSFQQFSKKYIENKILYINEYKELSRIKELQEYNYFLAGSDQIWNPFFAGKELYFLTFASPKKRIAFIASIGIPQLPENEEKRYKEYLSQMEYISVREKSAVKIINKLINKQVDCFFDPVLLVDRAEWIRIIEPVSKKIPSKYILCFFLGEEPREQIESFANENRMSIIYMNNKKYKDYYYLNPSQLLYLIKNADYILTDSFHVTAFSIIFQKQFYVFKRKETGMENMFSRMETLLGRLDLLSRVQDYELITKKENITEKQFNSINQQLVNERRRFDETMKKVLK